MSDSVGCHRQKPTRLPRPWDSPGKNTGVGCHFLLRCMKVKSEREVAQSCLTLRDPIGLQPTSLLHPWDFPGKSTGVGCHCLLRQTHARWDHVVVELLSCVQLFLTSWTVAYQSPPSMGFSRQEYWNGLPFPSTFPTISSVQLSHSVLSESLRPHELQQARPPCLSPTPGVHSDSRPSSQ